MPGPPSSSRDGGVPAGGSTWEPVGEGHSMHWKKRKSDGDDQARDERAHRAMVVLRKQGVVSTQMKKMMLDREVPFSQNPKEHIKLYAQAENDEWASWQRTGCVHVVDPEDVQ